MTPLLALGGSECERLGSGLFAQPVNTVSSAAFLLAGGWIVFRAARASARRVELLVYGAAVAANAVGGLLLHGLQTPAARWVHDLGILSVLLFILAFDVARFLVRPTQWMMRAYVASLAGLGLVLAMAPNITFGLYAVLGVAMGLLELVDYRRALPVIRAEGLTARWMARLGVVIALALGATAYLVGRSESPFCGPGSVIQWHAAWHVLAALAMGLYAYGAIEPHPSTAERAR